MWVNGVGTVLRWAPPNLEAAALGTPSEVVVIGSSLEVAVLGAPSEVAGLCSTLEVMERHLY